MVEERGRRETQRFQGAKAFEVKFTIEWQRTVGVHLGAGRRLFAVPWIEGGRGCG